jgi:hypothetical protein
VTTFNHCSAKSDSKLAKKIDRSPSPESVYKKMLTEGGPSYLQSIRPEPPLGDWDKWRRDGGSRAHLLRGFEMNRESASPMSAASSDDEVGSDTTVLPIHTRTGGRRDRGSKDSSIQNHEAKRHRRDSSVGIPAEPPSPYSRTSAGTSPVPSFVGTSNASTLSFSTANSLPYT